MSECTHFRRETRSYLTTECICCVVHVPTVNTWAKCWHRSATHESFMLAHGILLHCFQKMPSRRLPHSQTSERLFPHQVKCEISAKFREYSVMCLLLLLSILLNKVLTPARLLWDVVVNIELQPKAERQAESKTSLGRCSEHRTTTKG